MIEQTYKFGGLEVFAGKEIKILAGDNVIKLEFGDQLDNLISSLSNIKSFHKPEDVKIGFNREKENKQERKES